MSQEQQERWQNGDLEEKILRLDRIMSTIFRKMRARRSQFSPKSIAPPHFYLLRALQMKGTMRASDIADELRVSRGAISNLCDRLAEHELIVRERSTEDRRVVEISLSEEGAAFLENLEHERSEHLKEIFSHIPREDVDDLLRICETIADVLD